MPAIRVRHAAPRRRGVDGRRIRAMQGRRSVVDGAVREAERGPAGFPNRELSTRTEQARLASTRALNAPATTRRRPRKDKEMQEIPTNVNGVIQNRATDVLLCTLLAALSMKPPDIEAAEESGRELEEFQEEFQDSALTCDGFDEFRRFPNPNGTENVLLPLSSEHPDPYTFTKLYEVTRNGAIKPFSGDVDSNSTIYVCFDPSIKMDLLINVRAGVFGSVRGNREWSVLQIPNYSKEAGTGAGWDHLWIARKNGTALPETRLDLRHHGDKDTERMMIQVRVKIRGNRTMDRTMAQWSADVHDYGWRTFTRPSAAVVWPARGSGEIKEEQSKPEATGEVNNGQSQTRPYSFALGVWSGTTYRGRHPLLEFLAPTFGVGVAVLNPTIVWDTNGTDPSEIVAGIHVDVFHVMSGHVVWDWNGDRHYGVGVDFLPIAEKAFAVVTGGSTGSESGRERKRGG